MASFGKPPLRFRVQVRATVDRLFPGTNGSFGDHLIKDALALGLYCQPEYLLNL